jgi:hypothetical protein
LGGEFEEHEEHAMPCKKDIAVVHTIGIDTGKNTLHIVGLDGKGTIVLREKVSRSRIAARLVNVPPCLIGIEAGISDHLVGKFRGQARSTARRLRSASEQWPRAPS